MAQSAPGFQTVQGLGGAAFQGLTVGGAAYGPVSAASCRVSTGVTHGGSVSARAGSKALGRSHGGGTHGGGSPPSSCTSGRRSGQTEELAVCLRSDAWFAVDVGCGTWHSTEAAFWQGGEEPAASGCSHWCGASCSGIMGGEGSALGALKRNLGGMRRDGSGGDTVMGGKWTRFSRPTVVTRASGNDGREEEQTENGRSRGEKQQQQETQPRNWNAEPLGARSDPPFVVALLPSKNGTGSAAGQLSVAIRVAYSLALYGAWAVLGKGICVAANVDFGGTFRLDAATFYSSLLYALLPIFGSLVLHQDSVVESWAPARAVRDAEDEELAGFFLGMSPWLYNMIAAASALAEELVFRSAVQGGLAHTLQMTSSHAASDNTPGMSALAAVIPTFGLCSHAMAALLTAALRGSMFYVIPTEADTKVVVARGSKREMRKSLEAWHEREQMKKIYSPLVEALLSLYLSLEWIATGNLLAPLVTHTLYAMSSVTLGVLRIEEERRMEEKLRLQAGPDKQGRRVGGGSGPVLLSGEEVETGVGEAGNSPPE
eukprot:TRINITY_DN3308_c0_g1_i1.p1 TRINITY_DN3308_c0_g1~~TRINITY_DN3308_c0_g1_i1.p1  ORF type:complete len:543 (-),score=93.66 TRINITY_DN3308_c0_g1_i1:2541-4169(-)